MQLLTNKIKIMNFKIKYLITALALSFALISCDKDEETVTATSFDDFVKGNSSLTMFAKAIDKANLADFKTGGPFTWFAPTNAAFTAAGITEDSLNKMTTSRASYFLTYHLVNAQYKSTDMLASSSISRTTQQGSAVYNGSYNNSFYVNGGKISSVDNPISSGTIHVCDKFLVPPLLRGNIQAILNNSGQHTLLISALTKANLWAQLGTTSIFTLMAPNDVAMNAAGINAAYITATPQATLATVLRYHLFNSTRLFTNDFAADVNTIATAAGASTFLVTSNDGTKVKGKNNAAPVSIVTSDILGTNGVVHVIDGVLLQ
jgi:uncharacterized surface protein with fasciclin (FAS1) repeats